MKKFILALICLFCFSLNCFASEQEIVNSFVNFTNNISNEIRENYKEVKVAYVPYDRDIDYGDFWVKRQKTNLNSSIDIQQTTSLISPYMGILILSNDYTLYHSTDNLKGNYQTASEAEKANIPVTSKGDGLYKFIYMYQSGEWVLKRVQYRNTKYDEYYRDIEVKSPFETMKLI